MSVELVPLATASLKVGKPITIGDTGAGTRLVAEIESAVWEGDRLRARQVGVGADWPLMGADGVGRLDVRSTLQTDDGATIYVHYQGRVVGGAAGPTLYSAPLFETAAPQYLWLNSVQAVAKGRFEGGLMVYEVFEVR